MSRGASAPGLVPPEQRREWLRDNLIDVCGWAKDFTKGKHGWPVEKILDAMWGDLGGKKPATNSVANDIKVVRGEWEAEQGDFEVYSSDPLLQPHRFPEWRELCFSTRKGRKYETPPHQLAWAQVLIACALRDRPDAPQIPQSAIDFLGLPQNVNEILQDDDKEVSLYLLGPPRHGKTDLIIHVILWLICKDRTVNIMMCNGRKRTTARAVDLIRQQLEFNEVLVEKWGPFKGDNSYKWTSDEVDVLGKAQSKGRTLTGFPTQSSVLSLDADLIIVDDPMGSDSGRSEVSVDAVYEWLQADVSTRREPETALIGVGSHLPTITGDLWSRIEDGLEQETGEFAETIIVKSKAHNPRLCVLGERDESGLLLPGEEDVHEDCMLWPTVRHYPWLMAKKARMDPDMFEAVYNQEPRNPEADFFPLDVLQARFVPGVQPENSNRCEPYAGGEPGVLDYTRSWQTAPVPCCDLPLRWAMGVDPAPGAKSGKGSFNAIIVRTMCARCLRTYYVDYGEKRMSVERIPTWIRGYAVRYPKVQMMAIEVNAYQKALARDTEIKKLALKQKFRILEWTTDERKRDPELGVPSVGRLMRAGHSSMPARHREDRRFGARLVSAFRRWPGTPDDLPMADWLCEIALRKLVKRQQSTFKPGLVMPGHDVSPYWQKTVVSYMPQG